MELRRKYWLSVRTTRINWHSQMQYDFPHEKRENRCAAVFCATNINFDLWCMYILYSVMCYAMLLNVRCVKLMRRQTTSNHTKNRYEYRNRGANINTKAHHMTMLKMPLLLHWFLQFAISYNWSLTSCHFLFNLMATNCLVDLIWFDLRNEMEKSIVFFSAFRFCCVQPTYRNVIVWGLHFTVSFQLLIKHACHKIEWHRMRENEDESDRKCIYAKQIDHND